MLWLLILLLLLISFSSHKFLIIAWCKCKEKMMTARIQLWNEIMPPSLSNRQVSNWLLCFEMDRSLLAYISIIIQSISSAKRGAGIFPSSSASLLTAKLLAINSLFIDDWVGDFLCQIVVKSRLSSITF